MLRLFFLEIPLSAITALTAAYSSYIVTVGFISNLSNYPSVVMWLLAAVVLCAVLRVFNQHEYFEDKILLKNTVITYLPGMASLFGVFVLVAGSLG